MKSNHPRTKYMIPVLLLLVALLAAPLPAFGAMGEIESLRFSDMSSDLISLDGTKSPDGTPEAHFVVSIKGIGALSNVEIRALGTGQTWGRSSNKMLIQDSKGEILMKPGGSVPLLPFLGFLTLHIYIADNGEAFSVSQQYEVTVTFLDGSTAKGRVAVEKQGTSPPGETFPMEVVNLGIGNQDLTRRSEVIQPDGFRDAHFRVRFNAISVVTEIVVRNLDGTSSAWDTVPGNGIWGICVVKDGDIKNRSDGSVLFTVEGDTTLDLWFSDNGSVNGGDTSYEVIVKLNDGTTLRGSTPPYSQPSSTPGSETIVSAWLYTPSEVDITNKGETLGGDGEPDWLIKAELKGKNRIISFIVRGDDETSEWDTLPQNGKWLIGVTDSQGNIINNERGAVSIPFDGTLKVNLWISDNGSLSQGNTSYKLIAVAEDGRIYERKIIRTITLEEPLPPKITATKEAKARFLGKGPKNYLRKGEVSSLLEPPDANVDAHVELALSNVNGTIKSITIQKMGGGGLKWDTIPGNGSWNIVVTKTASGGILSNADGSISLTVSGNTTLHLWLADDGVFGSKPDLFEVIITMADGRKIRTPIH
jgi:hypothetical protein